MLRGFTPQSALEAPRFCISAGSPDAEAVKNSETAAGDINSTVFFEEGITPETVQTLRGMCIFSTCGILRTCEYVYKCGSVCLCTEMEADASPFFCPLIPSAS